jgi:hypothetical protein
MYPQRELIRLSVHKGALRRRIAHHRAECVEAAAHVARPLEWLDRVVAMWRRISPFTLLAAVPLGFLIKRTAAPKLKLIGTLMKWAPIIFSAVRATTARSTVARH